MTSDHTEIEELRWTFHETFGGEEFIEGSLIEATHQLWKVSAIIYGQDAAESAFDTLVGAIFPSAVREHGWREALVEEANGIFSDTPGGALLHDLTAYADYGIVVSPSRSTEEPERFLEQQVRDGLKLLELVALKLEDSASSSISRIVRKSHARWKLDSGQILNKEDLSLLSGLAEQSIRNRLAGKYREIHGTTKRVEASEALKWLLLQKHFVRSLWKSQGDTETVHSIDQATPEPVFVPIARDKSVFHPGLSKDGEYILGDVGQEQYFHDYDEALRALQEMLVPIWRRPSETGRWMQVRGVSWQRIDRGELAAKSD